MSDTRKIRLYSQDWSELLFETESPYGVQPQDAEDFLRSSGKDWLGVAMDYGENWKQRFAGRLELKQDGTVELHRADEYLKYLTWPSLNL